MDVASYFADFRDRFFFLNCWKKWSKTLLHRGMIFKFFLHIVLVRPGPWRGRSSQNASIAPLFQIIRPMPAAEGHPIPSVLTARTGSRLTIAVVVDSNLSALSFFQDNFHHYLSWFLLSFFLCSSCNISFLHLFFAYALSTFSFNIMVSTIELQSNVL